MTQTCFVVAALSSVSPLQTTTTWKVTIDGVKRTFSDGASSSRPRVGLGLVLG